MGADELKAIVGRAAVDHVTPESVIGVGTGSTVSAFIDALGASDRRLRAAVSSSEATSAHLQRIGVEVVEPGEVGRLDLYVDGADEIDPAGHMTKGGGGALTREKVVASMARRFLCIVDESKLVGRLGRFPIPVEVIPMATELLIARFAAIGGTGAVRMSGGSPMVTDNGQHIIDVAGLTIEDPAAFESKVNDWPGVVTVGVFAHRPATSCLVATSDGVRTIDFTAP